MVYKFLWFIFILLPLIFAPTCWAKDNAVILLYHHVSEQTPALTSVSPKVFRQHLEYLAANHKVLPLKTVIEAISQGNPLPDKAVVITFDDGYDNIFANAHPLLQEFGFPYTVFINPPLIGNASYQLNWQQIQTMSKQGVTFANHGNTHEHFLGKLEDEGEQQWLSRVMLNINQAEQSLEQQLGYSLKYVAYPYGEFNLPLKQALRDAGYIGFAQISGAVASYSDFAALPRYPAAGMYSNLNSLKTKLNSLAMPVSDITPAEPTLSLPTRPMQFEFKVTSTDLKMSQLNCFIADQVMPLQIADNKVTLTFTPESRAGRQRINCTAPSLADNKRYYWFSHPWFIPTLEGQWLD